MSADYKPIRELGHRKLRNEPLNEDDWREVYDFLRFQQQPFLERIVERARRRAAAESKTKPGR